jgi:hypothetical protein
MGLLLVIASVCAAVSLISLFALAALWNLIMLSVADLLAKIALISAGVDTIKQGGGTQPVDLTSVGDALDTVIAKLPTPAPGTVTVSFSPTSVSATIGQPVADVLTGSGGTGPYTFATSTFATSTFANTGATLNADGSFTPATTAGLDTVNVTVTDAGGASGSQSVSFSAA